MFKRSENKMFGTLIIAWILTWFDLDKLLITGINEIFNSNYTVAIYWLIAFIIGVIVHIKG